MREATTLDLGRRIVSPRYPRDMQGGTWLDEQLFEHRIVVVAGRLDDALAARTAGALMALDARGHEAVALHVDSPDGALGAAFMLMDTIDGLRSTLRIVCRGQVGGPVIGLLTAMYHRAAAPHTRFRLTQPTARFEGSPQTIAAQNREQQALLWRLCARLAQRTGRPAEEIAEDMRRGRALDSTEALAYGLVDEITSARAG
jgi:ATP-dependent Clp protease protease subunit